MRTHHTDIPILFKFHLPVHVPGWVLTGFRLTCNKVHLISQNEWDKHFPARGTGKTAHFVRFDFPVNYITAPVIATLFLLAITAIDRHEVHAGIIGNDETQISPYDVVLVFITMGYIGNSLAASGLVAYLVSRVLRKPHKRGSMLYLNLYICFFGLGAFIGNDPIMVLFLTYMTTASQNISHPRAYITTQFVISNVATGLLASSNPTNLVLAGTFNIRFIDYTANMAVPTILTALLLFPLLLYVVFADEGFLPTEILVREIPDEVRNRLPVNHNIPFASGSIEDDEDDSISERDVR